MSVTFGSNFIQIAQLWTTFKQTVAGKALAMQYDLDPTGTQYQVFAIDNPIVYTTFIYLGTVPDTIAQTYSQAQATADLADFQTNYQSICNKPLDMITTISGTQTNSGLVGFYGGYVPTNSTALTAVQAAVFVEQTTAASRSFSSTNANDNASGSGTRQVLLTYYDNNMNGPYQELITLNGLSNVNTVGGNIRFVESIKSTLTGTNGGNVGNINMFGGTSGTLGIIAQVNAGDSKTYYTHHYIRPNKVFYLENMFLHTSASNGTTGGSISLRVENPFIVNSFEDQIGTQFRTSPAQATHFHFNDMIQIAGPARVRFYVKPDASNVTTYFVNFGWCEY